MLKQSFSKSLRRIAFLCLLMTCFLTNAQIVNVENLRHEVDSIGWSGHARLDLEFEKNNTSRILNFTNQFRVQYKNEKNLWFFINDLNFKEINSNVITNNSTQHLRYSRTLSKKISFESFAQTQTDRISEIRLRALVGSGLRFNLYDSKKYKFFLGTTLMYEYEDSVDDIDNVQNNFRSSNYLSFKIKPNDNVSIVSSNYYQPLFTKFSDYRILSETSIIFKLFKNLSFISTIFYTFDSFPVTNVSKEQYKITNGLIYSFD